MAGDKTLLGVSLAVIAAIGLWGVIDPESIVAVASAHVEQSFQSRGWFLMLPHQ